MRHPAIVVPVLLQVLTAQYVVDPGGNGTHTDLQTAINQAPDGYVIKVVGGTWEPILIQRSVTIVGDPAPLITTVTNNGRDHPSLVVIDAADASQVVLSNLRIGHDEIMWVHWILPPIHVRRAARVAVVECDVITASILDLDGTAPGTPALQVEGSAVANIVDSKLRACAAANHTGGFWGLDGAPGIRADDGDVILIRSTVEGGRGAHSWIFSKSPPTPAPCPCPGYTGRGGPAVSARWIHAIDSFLIPGHGGNVRYGAISFYPWGYQADGEPTEATERVSYNYDVRLEVNRPMRLGQPWSVYPHYGYNDVGALVVATATLRRPEETQPGSWLYIDLSYSILALPLPPNQWFGLSVPDDPSLFGQVLPMQHVMISRLGRPLFYVLR